MSRLTTCLWFDSKAEEAAKYYVSIFKNAKLKSTARYSETTDNPSGKPRGSVMTVAFEIEGQDFIALNGGPHYKLTPAVSFMVHCKDQAEVDYYWDKLVAGGSPSQCGWLTDKFGVSWQIVPKIVSEVMGGKDPNRAERLMKALLKMKKLDVAALEKAAE